MGKDVSHYYDFISDMLMVIEMGPRGPRVARRCPANVELATWSRLDGCGQAGGPEALFWGTIMEQVVFDQ